MRQVRVPRLVALLGLAALVAACGDDGVTEPEGIGPDGGTVTSTDGDASVTVPAGALTRATTITVTVATSAPAGNVGTAYDFGPAGTNFAQPVTIRLSYDGSGLPVGVVPADLVLARVVGGQWQPVTGSTVDTGSETVSGPATAFSIWGIVPVTPSNVTAVAGDAEVTLSWSAVEGAASYKIYFKVDDASGVTAADESIAAATNTLAHEGLTNGSTYYYRVAAVNSVGEGSLSEEASATPLPAPPGAPQNLTAVPADGQVSLSWNPVEGAESYKIYFKVDASGVTASDPSIPTTSNTFVHEGLTNGSTYYYRVSAVGAFDVEGPLSAEVAAVAPVPAAPANLVTVPGDQHVSLSWEAVEGAESYKVYFKVDDASGVTTADESIPATSNALVHEGLTNGSTYYYRVTGVSPLAIEGPLSSEASAALVVPAQPQTVLAVAGPLRVTVSWDPVEGATAYNVYWKAGSSGVTTSDAKIEVSGEAAQVAHTGLEAGTPHYYIVTAVNPVGEGPASTEVSATPTTAPQAVMVAVGVTGSFPATCVVMSDGTVRCMGDNPGDGTSFAAEPVEVTGISAATHVSVGLGHACAVEGGSVKCWGTGTAGQLGNGANLTELEPVAVSGITDATTVEAGAYFSCAIEGGEVRCWGNGTLGELGTAPVLESSPVPVDAVPLSRPAGMLSRTIRPRLCAILPDPDPELWCWGLVPAYLGGGPVVCPDFAICAPVQIPMVTAEWISVGEDHACYLQAVPAEVECVGGAAGQFFSPLDESIGFVRVSAGDDFNCGYTPAGTVSCWGWNGDGQLGDGTQTIYPYTHPVTAIGINAATSISAGRLHACAVDDGVVKCWGRGFGTTPVVVTGF